MKWFEYLTTCNRKTFFTSYSYCSFIIVFLGAILLSLLRHIIYKEGFGATSPGTMVQLRTSHVPTEEDSYYWNYIHPRLVQKEIRNMTESDLR
jgi:hypothetical protein